MFTSTILRPLLFIYIYPIPSCIFGRFDLVRVLLYTMYVRLDTSAYPNMNSQGNMGMMNTGRMDMMNGSFNQGMGMMNGSGNNMMTMNGSGNSNMMMNSRMMLNSSQGHATSHHQQPATALVPDKFDFVNEEMKRETSK